MKLRTWVVSAGLLASGCGGRTLVDPSPCADTPPQCIRPAGGCEAGAVVAPSCDSKTSAWSCPAGARLYARARDESASCLPFRDPAGPVRQLGGSLVQVPIDGGRCLWVGETVLTAAGAVRNVGFEPDTSQPFGSCPVRASFLGGGPVSAVTVEGGDDPSILVQIDGGFRSGGETHVLYRLFRVDPSAGFGVDELGSGLGSWDAAAQRIVVPGPSALRWTPSLDLGDSSLVVGGVPYVLGCHGPPHFLTNSCDLARLDSTLAVELFAGPAGWVASDELARATAVLDSGPWISSIVSSPSSGFAHVYAVGFGSTLETHQAPAVTGPWTSGPTLAACDLPAKDRHAFCAGPVVHDELADPTRPGERVVSYGIGTTSGKQAELVAAHPEDYWTRLVRVPIP